MSLCPACSCEVTAASRFCPACGAALAPGDQLPTGPYQPAAATTAAARFAAGQTLAGRYRVVAPLGKGGMGEVYRADDLTLGQPVALKFLPPHLVNDLDRLARFRKEVATARQVSHPHVCRVYDLAEHGGQQFLTMEFIDGEDLASLLTRGGRLPEEKGIEISRQLCGALAAVHEQGLLHRDLKPHNVMLDGRGKVRLTDFGLAAAAADLSATEIRSGTPLYMAPEQLAGQEVSVQSDLFALGLVLYELFTGRKAFPAVNREELARKYAADTPSKPTSHVSGLNAAVERALLRCLQRQPQDRPRSAHEVQAALPGGDPLAAALAAGETPSPQMVADAGGVGALSAPVALGCLAAVLLGLVLIALASERTLLVNRTPTELPPAALHARAVEIVKHLGYTDRPTDSASGFEVDKKLHQASAADESLPVMPFWYRQSPELLVAPLEFVEFSPLSMFGRVGLYRPGWEAPGTAGVRLEPRQGKLIWFRAHPAHDSTAPNSPDPDAEVWRRWFPEQFTGVDLGRLHPVAATAPVPEPFDRQQTWEGHRPDGVPVRVEAALYQGRPVYFRLRAGAARPTRPTEFVAEVPAHSPRGVVSTVLLTVLFLGMALLAWRHLRLGRADRQGAARLAGAVLVLLLVGWLCLGHHLPRSEEVNLFLVAAAVALFWAAKAGLGYLALEPLARRLWPQMLTSWGRLFQGRWRDPLVGQHLLVGVLGGVVVLLVFHAVRLLLPWFGAPEEPPLAPFYGLQPDVVSALGVMILTLVNAIMASLISYLVYLVLLRLVVRNQVAAVTGVVVTYAGLGLLGALGDPQLGHPVVVGVTVAVYTGMFLVVLLRFGLLALLATAGSSAVLASCPLTLDGGHWYAAQGWLNLGLVAGLAGFGCVTARAGQPWFRDFFFKEP
jgi:serine/threonine-protein kinase